VRTLTGLRGRTRDERITFGDRAYMIFPRNVSSKRAAELLHRVFDRIPGGFAFRLWDGSLVALGGAAPVCTAVLHEPQTFIRLIRDPSPLNFAEAYVDGSIDLEGDLFDAMSVANSIEEIHVSFMDRLRVLVTLWRG
jgi:cyclopropane-fatty-acyl-phospholipid synthase